MTDLPINPDDPESYENAMAFDLPEVSDNPALAGAQIAARSRAILEHVKNKDYGLSWAHVNVTAPGQPTITLQSFADAMKIGGVRINVTAVLQQQIADLLGCMFMTPRIADCVFRDAQTRGPVLKPMPQMITASTAAMIAHSARVDKALSALTLPPGVDGDPLVNTVGKYWVLANELLQKKKTTAENYGWHFAGSSFDGKGWESTVTPPLRLIQGQGWAHDNLHVDYSQICWLVHKDCLVDGNVRRLADVLADPELCKLLNHNGPLKIFRQPGVDVMTQIDDPGGAQGAQSFLRRAAPAMAVGGAAGAIVAGPIGALLGAGAGMATEAVKKSSGWDFDPSQNR